MVMTTRFEVYQIDYLEEIYRRIQEEVTKVEAEQYPNLCPCDSKCVCEPPF